MKSVGRGCLTLIATDKSQKSDGVRAYFKGALQKLFFHGEGGGGDY